MSSHEVYHVAQSLWVGRHFPPTRMCMGTKAGLPQCLGRRPLLDVSLLRNRKCAPHPMQRPRALRARSSGAFRSFPRLPAAKAGMRDETVRSARRERIFLKSAIADRPPDFHAFAFRAARYHSAYYMLRTAGRNPPPCNSRTVSPHERTLRAKRGTRFGRPATRSLPTFINCHASD